MAAGVKTGELEDYFIKASSWDLERAVKAEREKKLAFGIAAGSITLALGTIVWHVAAPLRTVEPYVIRVDQQSGGVDVISAVKNTKAITSDEAVSKYFLATYIRLRESYVSKSSAPDWFKSVAVLSVPMEQEKIAAERKPDNPLNPSNIYTQGETVGVRVTNITFINPRVAQVRFIKIMQAPGPNVAVSSNWVATVNFKYVDKPETEADRLFNPLGFQVVSYRADPEVGR